jgi:hypothetical protein
MAEENGGLPMSPAEGNGPGWYNVDSDPNDQAYWDGHAWAIRRQSDGERWSYSQLQPEPQLRSAPITQRRWWPVGLVAVILVGVIVGSVVVTRHPKAANPAKVSEKVATTTSLPPSSSEYLADVVQCEKDWRIVSVALAAYNAQNHAYPVPALSWSAANYVQNFTPLVADANHGPFMPEQYIPSTAHYVIDYDSTGKVWIAPPNTFGTRITASTTSPDQVCAQVVDSNP